MWLSYVLLFSYLFSLFYLQLLLLLFMHLVSSARAVSPLHTHTHYGRVLTTLGLHVQLLDGCSNAQGSTRLFVLRGTGRSFFRFWYPHLFYISAIFLSLFICYHCVVLYVLLQWSLIIIVLIYSLFRLQFRLSIYTWGIFLAYMRRHNVSVSLGSGRYRVVSEPRFLTCDVKSLTFVSQKRT